MDSYDTTSFLQSFTRFACDNGYPKKLFVDRGSQLMKGCQETGINFNDAQFRLHKDVAIEFELCPVGGHNYNGKVERKIDSPISATYQLGIVCLLYTSPSPRDS